MKEIVVATKNAGKVAELAAALAPLQVVVRPVSEYGNIEEPEETGTTFAANSLLKARYYAQATGCACLADDSGLEADGLDGRPGVYSARFAGPGATDSDNNEKMLKELSARPNAARTARFRCVLAFCDTDGQVMTADGTCEGVILQSPQGSGGFGYDPLFFMPEYNKTLAQMSVEEKNAVSHRGKAVAVMVEKLAGYLS